MDDHLYAYLVNGEEKILTYISNCTEADRSKKFVCPGCGGEMGLRLGDIRRHHFYHKTECNCPGETYKHMVTKELFKKYFDSSASMLINSKYEYECEHVNNCKIIDLWKEARRVKNDIPYVCKTKYKDNIFDLKKYYTVADIEKHEGKYIADVLLTGEKAPDMLIEIMVTHKCTNEKQTSGNKIIEIDVSDLEEDQIEGKFRDAVDNNVPLDKLFPVKFYGMKKSDGKPPERVFNSDLDAYGRKLDGFFRKIEECSCEEYERRVNIYLKYERKRREKNRLRREIKKKQEEEWMKRKKELEERKIEINTNIINTSPQEDFLFNEDIFADDEIARQAKTALDELNLIGEASNQPLDEFGFDMFS